MGMYTEFHYNVELKQGIPEEVVLLLKHMINPDEPAVNTPDHKLFKTSRWDSMLFSDSYYFAADTHSTLRFDDIRKSWYLCIRCNLQNYDNEIQCFIDWIALYINSIPGDFLGFYRYEADMSPSLIYHTRNDWLRSDRSQSE